MVDNTLELLPGGAQFASERLMVMLPHESDGQYLVGPWNSGLFLFDGHSFRPFPNEADTFLRTNTLYKGVRLPDGAPTFETQPEDAMALLQAALDYRASK